MASQRVSKPTVNTNPGANHYAGRHERIIEYSDPTTGAGGLISLKPAEDGLSVHLYAHDPNVDVTIGRGRE